jgi:hypothetical protein
MLTIVSRHCLYGTPSYHILQVLTLTLGSTPVGFASSERMSLAKCPRPATYQIHDFSDSGISYHGPIRQLAAARMLSLRSHHRKHWISATTPRRS